MMIDTDRSIREFLAQIGRESEAPAEDLAKAARRELLRAIRLKQLPASYLDPLFVWGIENGRRSGARSIEHGLPHANGDGNGNGNGAGASNEAMGNAGHHAAHASFDAPRTSFRRAIPGMTEPINTLHLQTQAARFMELVRARFKVDGKWVAYGQASLEQLAARRTELERTRDGCARSIALLDELTTFIREAGADTLDEALAGRGLQA
jgi:hypothetical protein